MVEPTKCGNKDLIPASLMRFPEKWLLSFYSGVWLKMFVNLIYTMVSQDLNT
jgi:hypothetical protein